jgi:hypothetical protein
MKSSLRKDLASKREGFESLSWLLRNSLDYGKNEGRSGKPEALYVGNE